MRYAICLLLLSTAAHAEPLPIDKVPEPLKPWVQWVLDGNEERRCPMLAGGAAPDGRQRPCEWPARLELGVQDKQGRFRQDWQVYKDGWVPLPGDAKRWPLDLQVDGKASAAVLRENAPHVRLSAGAHTVTGEFRWDSMPELIQVPGETGLVSLSIRGKKVSFPNRDEEGRLWLQKASGKQEGESRIEVVVHRRVIDEIPLKLVTDIQLKVSGKNREVLLREALPQGFIPMSLTGPLPARLERDSRLRVQVRPGDWRLELGARHDGPTTELGPDAPKTKVKDPGEWDDEEVWVFDAKPDLRLVSVEGVPAVDPQQTELPRHWRHLPAYLLRPGEKMRLAERRRGDADPAPDQLTLNRTWWLDFDGGGYTVRDQVSGTLRRAWRMEMAEPTELGRVAVGGMDQFITRLKTKDGPAATGIEIRQGAVSLDADSRLPDARFRVPAVGWNHDFQQVSGLLNLPPGWRLVHAKGVDQASPTWVSRWTLLDLFIVLMVSLAAGRLWGRNWGVLTLVALALCYHESGAPRWIWVFLLALEALARALPQGKLQKTSVMLRFGLRVCVVLMLIPFFISQLRTAIYPQLEKRHHGAPVFPQMSMMTSGLLAGAEQSVGAPDGYSMAEPPPMPEEAPPFEAAADVEVEPMAYDNMEADFERKEFRPGVKMKAAGRAGGAFRGAAQVQLERTKQMLERRRHGVPGSLPGKMAMNVYAPDPKSQVSTGPGLPSWDWDKVSLVWRGPVKRDQRMWLFLVGPSGNFLLTLARLALLLLLTLCVCGQPVAEWLGRLRPRLKLGAGVMLLGLFLLPSNASAGMPTDELLNDLRGRLLRPAECEPNCVSIPRMRLEATADTLRARLEVAAGAPAGLPLPGAAQAWVPSQVLLDGSPAKGLLRSRDGLLYLPVGTGVHQVLLEGPLPERESVEVPLPLKPHRLESQVSGWTLDGVQEDGVPEDALQLSRVRAVQGGPSNTLQGGALPPFVRVERVLRLGLSWQVETRVYRLTPLGSAIVLDVPLLPGESVTTADTRVEKGKAKLSFGPQTNALAWYSELSQAESIPLKAPGSAAWTEVWRVDASPIWHLEAEGIPVVHSENPAGARLREWQPWPGEAVTLSVSRPEGVPGRTLTFDSSKLSVNPGLRATDVTLEFGYRSSRGGQHILTLPEGAELQSMSQDGMSQPVRQEGGSVTLPVLPGSHAFALAWREPRGIRPFYRVPEVKLGASSVNSSVSLTVSPDRWTLLTWGPRLGPAVLFWSVLAILALVSFGLGRLGITPLGMKEWLLLSIGLSQLPVHLAALVAGWVLVLGVRRKIVIDEPWRFDFVQLMLAFWSAAALVCLFAAIKKGLLGQPEMQISGNGSTAYLLNWYQDTAADALARPGLLSLPRMAYRLAMLAWALWLASSLLAWLRWGWTCVNEGGLWKQLRPKAPPPPPTAG
ncbi:MAG: hypothetical protein WC728_03275 [Elusimicrobiota bacterium]